MGSAISVRHETPDDHEAVHTVLAAAFGGDDEVRLVQALRTSGNALLSLVAEFEDVVAGHILFSPMTVESEAGAVDAVCLAPLAVSPEVQKRGIGTRLVETALAELREKGGARIVLLLGHPAYYRRFGFRPAREFDAHFGNDRDAFMALELSSGALEGVTGWARFAPEFDPLL